MFRFKSSHEASDIVRTKSNAIKLAQVLNNNSDMQLLW